MTNELVLAVVDLAMGMFPEISVEIFPKRGCVSGDFPVLHGVPYGDMFVQMKDSLTCDGVNGSPVGVLILTIVLFAIGMLAEILVEIATQRSGVACDLAVLCGVPDGDVLGGLGGGVGHGEGDGRNRREEREVVFVPSWDGERSRMRSVEGWKGREEWDAVWRL